MITKNDNNNNNNISIDLIYIIANGYHMLIDIATTDKSHWDHKTDAVSYIFTIVSFHKADEDDTAVSCVA